MIKQPIEITTQAIADFIQQKTGATLVTVEHLKRLSGGAIQQNWAFDAMIEGGDMPGKLEGVLRADAPSGVAISHGRDDEFALFKLMYDAGVCVPEPLWQGDEALFNVAFFIMRRVEGTAAAHRLAKDDSLGGDRRKLAQTLGRELAKIHAIRPPEPRLPFLEVLAKPAAAILIERARAFLDQHPTPYPALEWVLCWLEDTMPEQTQLSLCHRDFRTGNYMVDEQGLTGILDWEFADWSDPLEDIGWFCAKCWRFGNDAAEAGGIGSREDFYQGYEGVSGQPIPKDLVHYWEVMAHLNWAVIAIQQAERHNSGEELSLELALTGHMVPKLEAEMLKMTLHVNPNTKKEVSDA
ncbi:phosphotransferase family protein [uncultured Psychrobacter sp.]|uniref:phosphotransferase family protein n=1 Tax=uncultured Psychrobacter sp. TaxID=259303 RepID=UPI00345A04DF